MKPGKTKIAALVAAVAIAAPVAAAPIKVDSSLPHYKRQSGVAGNLNSVGSDTLNNMMTLWAEAFRKEYPNVRIQIEGKGSGTAPPAMIEGTSQLGPMSRSMKPKEANKFEQKYGFKPTRIAVALDSLAVYVNKDNPVNKLAIPEVDAIFSTTRKCGHPRDINTWGGVGLKRSWAALPISRYGRNSASGTYGYFKHHAMCKGDYRSNVKEQPGSASVVNGVANDKGGIGYSGIGYKTSGVKAIALSKKEGGKAYGPTYANVLDGKYPLVRQLYIYFVKKPHQPVGKLVREFLTFTLTQEGQKIVIKDGYLPLPKKVIEKQLAVFQ